MKISLILFLAIGFVSVAIGWPNFNTDEQMIYLKTLEKFRNIRSHERIQPFLKQEYRKALKGETIVKTGNTSDNKYKYIQILKRVQVPIWKYWATIIDRSHYTIFNSDVKESSILSQSDSSFTIYLYANVSIPFMSNRHQVLNCYANRSIYKSSGGKMWEHYWSIDPNASLLLETYNKKTRGVQEVVRNDGSWLLIALPDGTTLIEIYSVTHPGGKIPPFVIELVAPRKLKSTIEKFEIFTKNKFDEHFSNSHNLILGPTAEFLKPMELEAYMPMF